MLKKHVSCEVRFYVRFKTLDGILRSVMKTKLPDPNLSPLFFYTVINEKQQQIKAWVTSERQIHQENILISETSFRTDLPL